MNIVELLDFLKQIKKNYGNICISMIDDVDKKPNLKVYFLHDKNRIVFDTEK